MDLLQNPFLILTASTRDNRRRIMELPMSVAFYWTQMSALRLAPT
jgi:hypothetical protein